MTKATDDIKDKRMKVINLFLMNYKSSTFKVPENYDETKYRKWDDVQKTGLTFKEFYYCMCGEPQILKLGKDPLSDNSIRNYMKNAGYKIVNGYIYKEPFFNNQKDRDRLKNCIEYNKCMKSYIIHEKTISVKESEYADSENIDIELNEYCLVLCFHSNEKLHSIVEAIQDVYVNDVLGIVSGLKMIRVYLDDFIKAREIQELFR